MFREPTKIRVLIEASQVPDGGIITKRSGEKQYTLSRSIKIYDEGKREIKCDPNTIFIVSKDTANIISSDTVLLWECELWELKKVLGECDEY